MPDMTEAVVNRANDSTKPVRWAMARAPKNVVRGPLVGRAIMYAGAMAPSLYIGHSVAIKEAAWLSQVGSDWVSKPTVGSSTTEVTFPIVESGVDDDVAVSLRARLRELRDIAADEEVAWNNVAAAQLVEFLQALPRPSRPALAIDSNGDLRALWENMLREQVAVRFKGTPLLEAILFQKTEHGVRREILSADASAIISLITEMKLIHVTRG